MTVKVRNAAILVGWCALFAGLVALVALKG